MAYLPIMAHLFGFTPDTVDDLTWPQWQVYKQFADAYVEARRGQG